MSATMLASLRLGNFMGLLLFCQLVTKHAYINQCISTFTAPIPPL